MSYRLGHPFTLLLLGIAAAMFGLAAVAYRHRSRRVSLLLSCFLASVGLWTLADGLRIAAPDATHVLFWNKVAYVGIVSVLPSYILLIAALTNRERWFRGRYVVGLLGVSAAALTLAQTNEWHHLWHQSKEFSPGTWPPVIHEEWGVLWYFWATYAYGIVGVGVYFLGDELLRSDRSRLYRNQVGLVLIGVVVPIFANLLFTVFDVVQYDPLPISLSVSGVAFAAAIFRYDLLSITPIARAVVLDSVDSGVLVLDAEDAVVDANERAREVLDIPPERIPGVELSVLLGGLPEVYERLRDARETTENVTVDAGDGVRHYEVEVSPIEDDLGSYLGRAVVFKDVTDRVNRERDLRQRTDRLERQNDRLDELAAIVSHDLRNPLDVSSRRARHLRDLLSDLELPTETTASIEEEIDGIQRANRRAVEISDELLTISREDDGDEGDDAVTQEGERSSVPLRSVAADAWDTVETGDLDLLISGSRPVVADTSALRRLLENCYRNVVDHAGGARRVVVGASGDGFYVEDDGEGIPDCDRDRALERGVSIASDGAGLGLAIVEEVAEDHGWSVRLADGDEGGVRVEVDLDP